MTIQELALAELMNQQSELLARLARIENDRQHREQALSADSEERAGERENDEVLDRLFETTTQELAQVRRALDQIERGHHGSCTVCRQAISPARLRAVPEATECERCATRAGTTAGSARAVAS